MLDALPDEAQREEWRAEWEAYRTAWNRVQPFVTSFECNTNYVLPFMASTFTGEEKGYVAPAGNKRLLSSDDIPINMAMPNRNKDSDLNTAAPEALLRWFRSAHNGFIDAARDALGAESEGGDGGGQHAHGAVLRLPDAESVHAREMRREDLISYDFGDLMKEIRFQARQSLEYGEGKRVEFNWSAVQTWIAEHAVVGVPKVYDLTQVFEFLGEVSSSSDIAGIKQEELVRPAANTASRFASVWQLALLTPRGPSRVTLSRRYERFKSSLFSHGGREKGAWNPENDALSSLWQDKKVQDLIVAEQKTLQKMQGLQERVRECIGFVMSTGGRPGDTMQSYCRDVLQLDEQAMHVLKAHDGSAGSVTSLVCLKHLRSLDLLLTSKLKKDPLEPGAQKHRNTETQKHRNTHKTHTRHTRTYHPCSRRESHAARLHTASRVSGISGKPGNTNIR